MNFKSSFTGTDINKNPHLIYPACSCVSIVCGDLPVSSFFLLTSCVFNTHGNIPVKVHVLTECRQHVRHVLYTAKGQ